MIKKIWLMGLLALVLSSFGLAKADLIITPTHPDPFSVLGGQLTGALITHVMAIDQVTTNGNKIALVDSVLLAGHLKNDYLAQTRIGYNGTRNPDGTFTGGGFQTGEFFPINNIVNSFFTVPSQYEAIQNLQYGPTIGHDWASGAAHSKRVFNLISFDVGYRFGTNTTK